MDTFPLNIFLADDDEDDCLFFKQALAELTTAANLTTVHDGEGLMQILTKKSALLPHVLFLDLNMPRKNGFECLVELKQDANLAQIPVIILSTYFAQDMADQLHANGAHYCIQKPFAFKKLKQVIQKSITLVTGTNFSEPTREDFVLGG
jgi:CheY-like chemotaxis protein